MTNNFEILLLIIILSKICLFVCLFFVFCFFLGGGVSALSLFSQLELPVTRSLIQNSLMSLIIFILTFECFSILFLLITPPKL